jgi:hypothetical protein
MFKMKYFLTIFALVINLINTCSDCNSVYGRIKLTVEKHHNLSVSLEGANRTALVDKEGNFVL